MCGEDIKLGLLRLKERFEYIFGGIKEKNLSICKNICGVDQVTLRRWLNEYSEEGRKPKISKLKNLAACLWDETDNEAVFELLSLFSYRTSIEEINKIRRRTIYPIFRESRDEDIQNVCKRYLGDHSFIDSSVKKVYCKISVPRLKVALVVGEALGDEWAARFLEDLEEIEETVFGGADLSEQTYVLLAGDFVKMHKSS